MQAIGFSGTFASSGKVGVGPSAADWQDKLNQWHIARRNRLNAKTPLMPSAFQERPVPLGPAQKSCVT